VRVFGREVFTGPLPSNTRYTMKKCCFARIFHYINLMSVTMSSLIRKHCTKCYGGLWPIAYRQRRQFEYCCAIVHCGRNTDWPREDALFHFYVGLRSWGRLASDTLVFPQEQRWSSTTGVHVLTSQAASSWSCTILNVWRIHRMRETDGRCSPNASYLDFWHKAQPMQ
jgi:hypothetical protein